MHESAGRRFSAEETEVAWAAGLWARAFNVKKWHRDGYSGLSRGEAIERLRLFLGSCVPAVSALCDGSCLMAGSGVH